MRDLCSFSQTTALGTHSSILTSWSALTHASAHEHNRGSPCLVEAAARRRENSQVWLFIAKPSATFARET
jgi:hypothetical protein